MHKTLDIRDSHGSTECDWRGQVPQEKLVLLPQAIAAGTIKPDDMKLIVYCDDVQAAVAHILAHIPDEVACYCRPSASAS